MRLTTLFAVNGTGELAKMWSQWPWLAPVTDLVAGVITGIILERTVFRYAERLAAKTRWKADDLVVKAFRRMPSLWSFLVGAYFAASAADLKPRWEALVDHSILVILLGSLTLVAARITSSMIALYALKSEGLISSTSILRNLSALVVFICGALVIMDTLGISVTPILTALGVGGLAVALALQDTLSNLFAGVQILASRQVRVGDYVKLSSGEEGYVRDIRWRNTIVNALSNNAIVIPNSKLASTITTNYYAPGKEMSVLVQVGVAYGSDLEKVERVTVEVATDVMKTVPGGVVENKPFIRYHTFADSSINLTVILRVSEFTDQYLVVHEFIKRLHWRFRQENIEIPFPMRTVQVQQVARANSA